MTKPTPRFAISRGFMSSIERSRRLLPGSSPLFLLMEAALLIRIMAAAAVQWYVARGGAGRVCIFPDSEYYWRLAGTIRKGTLFQIVEWGDIPHFALRTPGYPLFLAACRALSGDHPLAVRLAQALLGAATVWLVYRLTREVVSSPDAMKGRMVPLLAAALVAFHPYFVVMSVLVLSEGVFVPLMVAALWGTAVLWRAAGCSRKSGWIALGVGMACGAAVLVRPSWVLFVPLLLAEPAFERAFRGIRTVPLARGLCLSMLGVTAVMAPWWIRNARVLGRFVPTAVWLGASLYDGLNPRATGASDMRFLESPEFWPLDELDQDSRLTGAAVAFARKHPERVAELAVIKLGRYWSPWPNAEGFRSPALAVLCAMVVVPVFLLAIIGLWELHRDPRAWLLLAGPLLYFCALHLVFASSMRYRIPGEVPAMGLAAAGAARLSMRRRDG